MDACRGCAGSLEECLSHRSTCHSGGTWRHLLDARRVGGPGSAPRLQKRDKQFNDTGFARVRGGLSSEIQLHWRPLMVIPQDPDQLTRVVARQRPCTRFVEEHHHLATPVMCIMNDPDTTSTRAK